MGCGTALRRSTSGRGSSRDPRPFVGAANFIDGFLTKVSVLLGVSAREMVELIPLGDVYTKVGLSPAFEHIDACRLDAFVESGEEDLLLDADEQSEAG